MSRCFFDWKSIFSNCCPSWSSRSRFSLPTISFPQTWIEFLWPRIAETMHFCHLSCVSSSKKGATNRWFLPNFFLAFSSCFLISITSKLTSTRMTNFPFYLNTKIMCNHCAEFTLSSRICICWLRWEIRFFTGALFSGNPL